MIINVFQIKKLIDFNFFIMTSLNKVLITFDHTFFPFELILTKLSQIHVINQHKIICLLLENTVIHFFKLDKCAFLFLVI